jgi:hypothetical protein
MKYTQRSFKTLKYQIYSIIKKLKMFSNCNTKLVSKSYQLSRLFRPENLKSNLLQTCQLSNDGPHKTCLYDFHVSRSGKMVDFAGYLMPVQYGKEGIAASHIHTRSVIFRILIGHKSRKIFH